MATTPPKDPILAKAQQQAQAAIAPVRQDIQTQAAQAAAANDSHGQAIQGFSSALAEYLKGIAPQTQQGYDLAAQRTATFAEGFTKEFQKLTGASADEANAMLQKWGDNPTVKDTSAQAGNVLYGLGGYIPASTLEREGAAFGAVANLQPSFALQRGQQDYTSNVFAGKDEQKRFEQQIAALNAKAPGLVDQIRQELADEQLKQKAFNLNQQVAAQNLGLKVQNQKFGQAATKVRLGIEQQNANTAAANAARAALNADRQYRIGLRRLGVSEAGLQLRARELDTKQRSGGFTPAQLQKFQGQAFTIADDAFNGYKVNDEQKPGVGYQQAMKRMLRAGIPPAIAVAELNQHYTVPGERGRPYKDVPLTPKQQKNAKRYKGKH